MDELTKVPVLRPSVSIGVESGQLFLYCTDTKSYATMDNEVASTVVKLCDGNRSVDQIILSIFNEYESRSQEEIGKDIMEMLQVLEGEHFIDFK